MHYLKSTIPLMLLATLASADTTAATSAIGVVKTTCATDNTIAQCIQSMQSILNTCALGDWACQCTSSTNMVNCYKDCPDDPSRVYAESTRQQKCARTKPSVRISTPALAMRSGAASVIPSASATAGASRALATETSNNDEDNDGSNSDADDDFNEGVPTKSYSGLEANSIASLKEGSASDIKALTWVSLLGLGVAVLF